MCSRLILFISTLLVAAAMVSCGSTEDELVWNLTHSDVVTPPESRSNVPPTPYPTLFVRKTNGELRGIVAADPLAGTDGTTEQSIADLTAQLRYVRQALEDQAGDSIVVPPDVLLVLDRNMTFGDAMGAIYTANGGSFPWPHLVMSNGMVHDIEPPRVMGPSGPIGWSAWLWVTDGDSVRWMPTPAEPSDMRFRYVPPVDGEIDLATLVSHMRAEMDTLDHVPPGPDRLIGLWVYDDMPYPKFIEIADALRFPEVGDPLGGRITVLQGLRWRPPPSAELDARVGR